MIEAMGRDASGVKRLPLPVARVAAVALEAFWRLTNRSGQPPLTRTSIELIGTEVTVNDAKARRELGYAPVITRAEGLAELRSSAGSRSEPSSP
jgi:nucleoside-diphosphate-sugar epimerase